MSHNMKKKNIGLYTDISGNKIGIITYEYGVGKPGLYIQGGVHGGEITYFIFEALHRYLKHNEKKLKKRVLLAPIINPTAWNQRMYYYTVGKFDLYKGADWNRKYPGDQTSLSARNSKAIFDLAEKYPFAIDLHTARHSLPYNIFSEKKMLLYIKSLGLQYNFFHANNASKYQGAFHVAMTEIGISALTIETGSHDNVDEESIDKVVHGLQSLLSDLDILPQKPIINNAKQFLFDTITTIFSEHSGFAKYYISPQQNFKKNELLGEIYLSSSLGKVTKIIAPFDGIMFELPRTNIIWTGDELFRVIKKNVLKEI